MTNRLESIDPELLSGIHGGDWQADFVTGLAAGMTLDSVLYVGRLYVAKLAKLRRERKPMPRRLL